MASCPGLDVDAGGTAVLRWGDGVPVSVHAGWTTRPGGLKVLVEGTVATASVDGGTLIPRVRRL